MDVLSQPTELQLTEFQELNNKCLETLKDCLKLQGQFYREQNTHMESVLKKLELLKQDLSSNALEKLVDLQESYNSSNCSMESFGYNQAERIRKRNNYTSKIKICMKIYSTLTEKLAKELKTNKSEVDSSKEQVSQLVTVSTDEIKTLEARAQRYEKEILKFEKKYPWLREPEYNLHTIAKEIKQLTNLRCGKDTLSEEIDSYHGLKPDIMEAREQLNRIKQQYNALNKLPK